MKIILSYTIISILLVLSLSSDAQDTTFIYTYGGSGYDHGRSVQQTTDGGFILAGSTSSGGAGSSDVYLIKIDSLGNFLWSKTYGGTGIEWGYSVKQTIDGGYIIAGYTNSFGAGGYDAYLIKTDSIGDTLWTKTYGGTDWDFAYKVIITPDKGYALVGETYSFGAGNNDVWLIKTDSMGDTLWTKTYGGTNTDIGRSVQNTFDNGYIIAGETNSFGLGDKDIYVVKTNSFGDTLWTNAYGWDSTDFANDVIQTSDSIFIVAGATNSIGAGKMDGCFLKIDSLGNLISPHLFGGADNDECRSIKQINNNNYAILGYTESFGNEGKNLYFIITDSNGWQKDGPSFGGNNNDEGFSLELIKDGGYVMLGTTESYGLGYSDIFLIKYDSSWYVNTIVNVYYDTTLTEFVDIYDHKYDKQNLIRIYPNPFISYTTIDISAFDNKYREINFVLYDLLGQKLKTVNNIKKSKFIFQKENLSSGIYIYEVTVKNFQISRGKLIIND